jgi:3-oxoacyl-[acyl-carrier-protein] synthase-3
VSAEVGILGLGASVPRSVRRNDDPIFNMMDPGDAILRTVFAGTMERRVLAPGEPLADLMETAARAALDAAGIGASEVDRLIGYESLSDYLTPNGLYLLHRRLGLSPRAMVLPVNCDFSNFVLGVATAAEAVSAGRCGKALVACGSNWTRFVDYHKPHTLVAGDGAGAAVVGRSDRLLIVDYAVETDSRTYDLWTMKARVLHGPAGRYTLVGDDGLPLPTYELAEHATPSFITEALEISSRLALDLLSRNGVSPSEVTLIPHQTKGLINGWAQSIAPAAVLDTYETLGNMSHASIPVTLALRAAEIRTPFVLLVSAGTGSHFAAMLLRTHRAGTGSLETIRS